MGQKGKVKANSLAAWHMVCKPKKQGSLGITNLKIQNVALLLKHLHKFYNQDSTPWVQLITDAYYHQSVPHVVISSGSFWWRGVLPLMRFTERSVDVQLDVVSLHYFGVITG